MKNLTPVAFAAALACASIAAHAQTATPPTSTNTTLPAVKVTASADASAEGLSPAYAGGQVARGGRAGILGTKDNMETPFSITAYTNELIQDKQAKSVGDVLQNDPSVRVARGFGNFQESYFIRGYLLGSDDIACRDAPPNDASTRPSRSVMRRTKTGSWCRPLRAMDA